VAFIDHDEIEEIGRVVVEDGLSLSSHERLKDCKENARVLGHSAFLTQCGRVDPGNGVGREG
jgi:hypothetical protein